MKKQFILILTIMAMLACIFAISASADTIVPATTNEYGELTVFDEAIGNTNIANTKDDGTVARTVLFDGTNYYTVPTTYILTESPKNGGEMLLISFTEINSKLEKSFDKNSIIRSEIPSGIAFICNNMETYKNCANVVEIIINDGLRLWDNSDQRKQFSGCTSLKTIDLSGMVLQYTQTTASMFEGCSSLESITLPDAYVSDGVPLNYNISYMFNGCSKLATIENADGFFKGVKSIGFKAFWGCSSMTAFEFWDGLEGIEGRAFSGCSSITSLVFPDSLTTLVGSSNNWTIFENCSSLKKIVFPNGPITVGDYVFEKCKALEAVWMPSEASNFGKQVFGQCGSSRQVTFYFQSDTNNITISDIQNNDDPFITALNTEGDTRIQYSTPLSTKCIVFLGGHTNTANGIAYENGFDMAGKLTCTCSLCQTQSTEACNQIITILGYAVGEKDGRITVSSGFTVDTKLVELYNSLNGVSLEIGVLFANTKELSTAPTNLESIKHFTNGGTAYSTYNYIVTFPNEGDENYEKYASYEFVVSAFIKDGQGYSFVNGDPSVVVKTLDSGFTTTTLNKIQEVTKPVQQNEALEVACINAPVYAMAKSNDELYAYIKESYRV